MSKGNSGIPWPVWAFVMIAVALIGAFAALYSTIFPTPTPPPTDTPPPTIIPTEIPYYMLSSEYLMDNLSHRRISVVMIGENKYRAEEGGSWPWTGILTVEGKYIHGEAEFLTSQGGGMDIEGTILEDGRIDIDYRFDNPERRIDYHIWHPVD